MNGLEPVSDIRQRPLDDDAHGVVQEGLLHLFLDEAGDDPLPLFGRGHSFSSLGSGKWDPGGTGRGPSVRLNLQESEEARKVGVSHL
jgi:hypothetical protein